MILCLATESKPDVSVARDTPAPQMTVKFCPSSISFGIKSEPKGIEAYHIPMTLIQKTITTQP